MASSTIFAVTARRTLPIAGRSTSSTSSSSSTSAIANHISSSLSSWQSSRRGISSTSVVASEMHPNYTIDSIKPPKYWGKPDEPEQDPNYYHRKPVSSAHAIDLTSSPPKLSSKDSAALSPSGSVIHGRYGELPTTSTNGIPLEYLALLHPAAEGAAALRTVAEGATEGTLLIYGVTEPAALSALQLASSSNIAVIGVAGGVHSSQSEFLTMLESLTVEPGTIVPEEYAIVKSALRDLVHSSTHGDSASDMSDYNPQSFVDSFKANLLEYSAFFPETQLSPDKEEYTFDGKEKDRDEFNANMSTYLSQFPKGAPAIDPVVLEEAFTKEQYALFKSKFHKQTTAVITGDDDALSDFSPANIVKKLTESPESVKDLVTTQEDGFIPYEFSPLVNQIQNGLDVPVGGPVLGAIVAVTPELKSAAEAVAKGKTIREKAEALQFLTEAEKNAFAAYSSVVGVAKDAGKSVAVVGGELPELKCVVPSEVDVKDALSAMALEEDGSGRLDYFIQIYRASDYPIYADYALHRATEAIPGPRQIVVTK